MKAIISISSNWCITTLLLSLICLTSTHAQNLERLGDSFKDSKAFSLQGNLFTNSSYLDLKDNPNSLYTLNFGGQVNISLYGVQVPIRFVLRNSSASVSNTLNFSRFGLSPRYKAITIHGGYRSMNIHPFIYKGQTFLGGGTELNLRHFNFKALYGNLQDFVTARSINEDNLQAFETFSRKIIATAIGFKSRIADFAISSMQIKDDENTPSINQLVLSKVNPKENLAFGVQANLNISKFLRIKTDIAASAITEDKTIETELEDENLNRISESALTVNITSRYALAYDTELRLRIGRFDLGANYRLVEPNYSSLGIYQMNNDYEDYYLFGNANLLRGKLILNLRYGIRNNNLSNVNESKDRRNILNANINLRPFKYLNVSGRYIDHATEQESGFVELEDSLKFVQANKTLGLTPSISFNTNSLKHTLRSDYLVQNLSNITSRQTDLSTELTAVSLTYKLKTQNDFTAGLRLRQRKLLTNTKESTRSTFRLESGYALFDKKLNLKVAFQYGQMRENDISLGNLTEWRLSLNYLLEKKHRLTLASRQLKRPINQDKKREETRINLSYNYSFSI